MGPPLWDLLCGTTSIGTPVWDPGTPSMGPFLYGTPVWDPLYGTPYGTLSIGPIYGTPYMALYGTPLYGTPFAVKECLSCECERARRREAGRHLSERTLSNCYRVCPYGSTSRMQRGGQHTVMHGVNSSVCAHASHTLPTQCAAGPRHRPPSPLPLCERGSLHVGRAGIAGGAAYSRKFSDNVCER